MEIFCIKSKIYYTPDFIFLPIRKGIDKILISKYKKIIITFNGQGRLSNFINQTIEFTPEFSKMRSVVSAQRVRDDMTKFVNIYTVLGKPEPYHET